MIVMAAARPQAGRPATGAALLCTVLLAAVAPYAHAQPQFVGLNLPGSARGRGIVEALGDRLPEVAAAYGLKAAELVDIANRDNDIVVNPTGHLIYQCDGLAVPENGTADTHSAPGEAHAHKHAATPAGLRRRTRALTQTYSTSQAFFLHSRPGSTKVSACVHVERTARSAAGTRGLPRSLSENNHTTNESRPPVTHWP